MRSPTRLSAIVVAAIVVVGGTALAAKLASDGGGSDGTTTAGQRSAPGGGSIEAVRRDPPTQQGTPSEKASMICGAEIHGDVASTFEQPSLPDGKSTWSGGRLFLCRYELPQGPLMLAVKDSLTPSSGAAYFKALRAFDGEPDLLGGLQGFGLPSYETADGKVVFLKDGKTLVVDAGGLGEPVGPNGESRQDVAYAIAADVIGCWNE